MALTKVSYSMIQGASVNVLDYGAVGDGITNDTAAINAALNAIKTTGGTVFLPKGIYYVPNGINFYNTVSDSANTFRIIGQGAKESIIKTQNALVSLDLGGRNRVHLIEMGIVDSGTTAEVGIARYRENSQGGDGGGQYHYYENLYMEGKWSKAAIYSLASEVNTHVNLEIQQIGSGSAYYTASTNLLNATLAGTLRVGYTSNTANTFLGGALIAGDAAFAGKAVYFGSSAGNFQMFGTYLVATNFVGGGAIVKFGNASTDAFIENYNFSGCRFEGYTDAFNITASFVEGLNIQNCVFGQSVGKDINYTNSSLSVGLNNAFIANNYHKGQGLSIPVITGSRIVVEKSELFSFSAITINNGNVVRSHIEGSVNITGTTFVYASVITDVNTSELRVKYGPNSKTSAGNDQGSVIVNQPFGTAPVNPLIGTIVTAGASNWDPSSTGTTGNFPVFYDGSNWREMTTLYATISGPTATGIKGTLAVDANYLYVCTAANTWKRIALTW